MGRINNNIKYPIKPIPVVGDTVIGTDSQNNDKTVQFGIDTIGGGENASLQNNRFREINAGVVQIDGTNSLQPLADKINNTVSAVTVLADEIPLFRALVVQEGQPPFVYFFGIKGSGKGVYGVGGTVVLDFSSFIRIEKTLASYEDTTDPNAIIENLGEVVDGDFVLAINNSLDTYLVEAGTNWFFEGTVNTNRVLYGLSAPNGTYGAGGTAITSGDLFLVYDELTATTTELPTGLEAINEGNGIGWRLIGKNPSNFATNGKHSVDFGSYGSNKTQGASGTFSFNHGEDNVAGAYGSITMGAALSNTGQLSTLFGTLNSNDTYGTLLNGYDVQASGGINRGYNLSSGRGNRLNGGFGNVLLGTSLTQTDGVGVVVLGHGNEPLTTLNNTTTLDNPVLIVGNGTHTITSNEDWTVAVRSNALVVRNSGLITADSLTNALIDAEPTGKVLITKEYLAANAAGIPTLQQVYDNNSYVESPLGNAMAWYRINDVSSRIDYYFKEANGENNISLRGQSTSFDYYNPTTLVGNGFSSGVNGLILNTNSAAGSFNLRVGSPSAGNVDLFAVSPSYAVSQQDFYIPLRVNGVLANSDGDITIPTVGTGLQAIDEGNGIGWRLADSNPNNYGNIGEFAVNLSVEQSASTTRGATGRYSFTAGTANTASGEGSFACGFDNNASGDYSFTFGKNQQATGTFSVGIGQDNIASGAKSFALGYLINAKSFSETVFGYYNTDYTPISAASFATIDPLDRLFSVGNGNPLKKADAFTILKGGQTAIGISNFEANTTGEKLQVNGTAKANAIQLKPLSFSGLPVSPNVGLRMMITDATVSTFYSIVSVGGGAITVPIFFDGTNWRVG